MHSATSKWQANIYHSTWKDTNWSSIQTSRRNTALGCYAVNYQLGGGGGGFCEQRVNQPEERSCLGSGCTAAASPSTLSARHGVNPHPNGYKSRWKGRLHFIIIIITIITAHKWFLHPETSLVIWLNSRAPFSPAGPELWGNHTAQWWW